MLDFSNAVIEKIIAHQVGSSYSGELPSYAKSVFALSDKELQKVSKMFTKCFINNNTAFQFTHSVDRAQNTMFAISEKLLSEQINFTKGSIDIVKYLREQSRHHAIKPGEVFIVQFNNVKYAEELSNAIAIFKIESTTDFVKVPADCSELSFDKGILQKNIEKACLVFNYNYDEGFDVFNFEKANETQYWQKDFLNISIKENEYNTTQSLLQSVNHFAQHGEGFENKKERIDFAAQTIEVLQSNEAPVLYIDEFIKKNLPQKQQDVFLDYLESHQEATGIAFGESIQVSQQAVNKYAKQIKSVIKLDKNFHIYVHGDRDQIENGVDNDGRKYYKLYYTDEA